METDLQAYKQYIDLATEYGISYGMKFVFALLIFFIGKRIVGMITGFTKKTMQRQNIDVALIGFLNSILYWGLLAIVIIAALGQLGVQTASFVAMLGAAGLAVGLALQGSLSNFAAGVLIILLRPIRVGDFVEMAGESGSVKEIKIFTTELRTGDNKAVIIPNSRVLDSNIVNYSSTGTRRIDLVIGVSYDDDLNLTRRVLNDIVNADERILASPEPTIAVNQLADSSVNFIVRPWVKSDDYWAVHNSLLETIKNQFDQHGISIPFPQRVITTISETKE